MECPKCKAKSPLKSMFSDDFSLLCRNQECRYEGTYDDFWTEEDQRFLDTMMSSLNTARFSRKLCYRHHCDEFDKLSDGIWKARASTWQTVDEQFCELCHRGQAIEATTTQV